MRTVTVRVKMLSLVAACFLVASAAMWWQSRTVAVHNLEYIATEEVRVAELGFAQLEQASTEKLAAALDVICTREDLRELFVSGDREGLCECAEPLFSELRDEHGITQWCFESAEPNSEVFLRVHNPGIYGDELSRMTYLQAVETKDVGMGKDLGLTAFALRVVRPYWDEDGTCIGYVELGQSIDQFLALMSAETGNGYAMVVRKEFLDEAAWASVRAVEGLPNDWDDFEDNVLIGTAGPYPERVDLDLDVSSVGQGGEVLGVDSTSDGRVLTMGAFPVFDAGGTKVGAVVLVHDVTEIASDLTQGWIPRAILAGVLLLVLMVLLHLESERLVFRRLRVIAETMDETAERVSDGDWGVSVPPAAKDDEIGTLERSVARFLATVSAVLRGQGRGR